VLATIVFVVVELLLFKSCIPFY